MKLIKTGITRWVILTDKYAIKFPNPSYSLSNFLQGWIANITEYNTWTIFNSEDIENKEIRNIICPVLKQYLWGFISIMPKCKEVPKNQFPEINPHLNIVNWGDYKIDNYGLLNGRLVCLDYDC